MITTKFYVIFKETGAIKKGYKTHRGAKNCMIKLNEQRGEEVFELCSAEFWADTISQRMVTVKNIMNGKEVEIRAVDQGGACDPSTERYHSM